MPRVLPSRLRTIGMAAQNALEIIRFGHLRIPSYTAPYDVVHEAAHYRLRRYRGVAGQEHGIPILLVPPLMVTAEVYDIAPDISAVAALLARGADVWLVDFGAPEREEGGMARTLDDHVRAVDDAVDRVRRATGRDVHLAGYSQGGMFAYQVAAYRASRGLASVITFGSPVDIHRSIPQVHDAIAERLIAGLRAVIARPLNQLDGLPGAVTSTGFKVLSARKEIQQIADFVRKLHDRQALERRASRRRFLGGGGFVAWPGPALRTFIDEIVVHNRMLSGGFVIDGRTVTLADIRCPILYFVGTRDTMGRPPAVRGIRKAAPYAEIFEVAIKAGHFGLVVGSAAQAETWPTVSQWLEWRAGQGPRPERLPGADRPSAGDTGDGFKELRLDLELLYDVAEGGGHALWTRLGESVKDLSDTAHDLRVQVGYIHRLREVAAHTEISASKILAERAAAMPEGTFFLWRGRAFSYAEANHRVDNVVRGLIACGVRPGQRVGVLMASRPSYLSILAALNRLGAVAVLISPDSSVEALSRAIDLGGVATMIVDPDNMSRGRAAFSGPVLVLGGGHPRALPLDPRASAGDLVDMEAIDPDAVELPAWYRPDSGRAGDLAMIIFGAGRNGQPRASYITNHRWAFSAFGAAATCTLTSRDTVYCCLPLHHAAGSLVSVGSALVGGARLALATPFEVDTFWAQVRRYGATVVFYAGEMCRALVDAPPHPADSSHPVRLFAGSGMRVDVWRRVLERFAPVGVLEFYASTEGNVVLANASGEKIGSLGHPIPGSAELAVVAYDFAAGDFVTDDRGRLVLCGTGEPGVLLARLDETHPSRHVSHGRRAHRVRRHVFARGDAWFVTGDVVRRDAGGDYWFVDRLRDMVVIGGEPVATPAVEDVLYQVEGVALAVVYGAPVAEGEDPILVATVVTRGQEPLDADAVTDVVTSELAPRARPRFVRCVDGVPMTDGYRPIKSVLRQAGVPAESAGTLRYDAGAHRYRPMDERGAVSR